MRRSTALKFVNPVLAILLISQVGTGILHGVLPRQLFDVAHEMAGLVLGAMILLHVILNWNWVRASYGRSGGRR